MNAALELPVAALASSASASASSPADELIEDLTSYDEFLSGPCGGSTGGGAATTGGGDNAEAVGRAVPLSTAPSATPSLALSPASSSAAPSAAASLPLLVRCNASGALLRVTCPAGAVSWNATCPPANVTRACLYYNHTRAAWSSRGVGVASRDASAALAAAAVPEATEATTRIVRCETTHLSEFAEAVGHGFQTAAEILYAYKDTEPSKLRKCWWVFSMLGAIFAFGT